MVRGQVKDASVSYTILNTMARKKAPPRSPRRAPGRVPWEVTKRTTDGDSIARAKSLARSACTIFFDTFRCT